MRLPLIVSLLVLFGLALPVQAQPAESVSHEMIVAVLEQLGGRWAVDDYIYSIEVDKHPIKLYRLDGGKRLLLKAAIKAKPSLETINRYNEKTAVTTRAVRYEKFGTILESGLDAQLGVTPKGLKKFFTRFIDDVGEFKTFLAKNSAPDGDGPKGLAKREKQKPPLKIAADSDDREFVITFPTHTDKWDTAWKISWDVETAEQATEQGLKFGSGGRSVLFKIKKAYFKPGRAAEWIQVLEDAHPQEFYVPYYFRGTRFYDLRDVGGYVSLSAKEGGAVSQLMGAKKQVIAELRDTGPAYKHGSITRRGEELTLFANFQAANYTYMVEFGFRDDGGIVFRHSPTGYNYFSHFDASHMHGSFWRIGMKLGPDGNNDTNQVHVVRLPTDPKAQGDGGKLDVKELTKESFVDWNPQEFTRIRITNPKYFIVSDAKPAPEPLRPKLPKGKPRVLDQPSLPISYDLVTYPQGIARHKRFDDEKFTHHDFWITRQDSPEKMYVYLGKYFFTKSGEANPNLKQLDKKNVVLWHSSSGLHTPRAEDGIIGGAGTSNGQATIYWTTFELRPRNLFVRTPLYRLEDAPPPKLDVRGKGFPKIEPTAQP